MFNCLPSITQCLHKSSVTHTRPVDNAGVSNQPASESPVAFASRSPQRNQGCVTSLQRTRLTQAYLLGKTKSAFKKDVSQFFMEFDASKLTEKSRIELARFVLEENPRALGENIQKLRIADESARIDLARRFAEKDRSAYTSFAGNIKNFEIPCETALIQLADLIKLEVKPLPSSIAHKSLDAIAQECNVPIKSLEAYLKKEIGAFADKMKNANRYGGKEYSFLQDKIYNLYVIAAKQGDKDLPLPWMKNLKNYDAFIGHFCPSANANARAYITSHLKNFVVSKVSSGIILHEDERTDVYGMDDRTWKKHHTYGISFNPLRPCVHEHLVDEAILAEVAQLKESGLPNKKDHLFHGTGSAALASIGEAGAILSARQALQSKGKVVTGEYVSYINSNDGEISATGGKEGLDEVYTLRNSSLASDSYTTQRWFDECPVMFGIDVIKQKEYNEAQGIGRGYDNDHKGEGTVVGPKVPLQNVVAVSAPKEYEARIQAWIQQYCPWVKFISKEAATIMEMEDRT